MTGVCMVLDKRRKLQFAVRMRIGGGRHVPYFEFATETDGEVTARRGERECCGGRFEREVVDGDAPCDIGQYGLAIFVDCKKQVALRREPYSRNVLSVGKGKRVRLVAAAIVNCESQGVSSGCTQYAQERRGILNKVEDCHSIAYRREKVGPIWAEDQIAPAINSSEEVGELDAKLANASHMRLIVGYARLEIRLHFQSIAMFFVNVLRSSPLRLPRIFQSYLWGHPYRPRYRVPVIPVRRDPC